MTSDEQSKLIEATRQAIPRARTKSDECQRAGLTALARFWRDTATNLEHGLAVQLQMLEGSVPNAWKNGASERAVTD